MNGTDRRAAESDESGTPRPTWTVEVDRPACMGTGICASAAPAHFVVTDGKARPRTERAEPSDGLADAAALCPTGAVLVRDENGELIE